MAKQKKSVNPAKNAMAKEQSQKVLTQKNDNKKYVKTREDYENESKARVQGIKGNLKPKSSVKQENKEQKTVDKTTKNNRPKKKNKQLASQQHKNVFARFFHSFFAFIKHMLLTDREPDRATTKRNIAKGFNIIFAVFIVLALIAVPLLSLWQYIS